MSFNKILKSILMSMMKQQPKNFAVASNTNRCRHHILWQQQQLLPIFFIFRASCWHYAMEQLISIDKFNWFGGHWCVWLYGHASFIRQPCKLAGQMNCDRWLNECKHEWWNEWLNEVNVCMKACMAEWQTVKDTHLLICSIFNKKHKIQNDYGAVRLNRKFRHSEDFFKYCRQEPFFSICST